MLLVFLLVAFSCVDDDAFFSDNNGIEKITATTAMVTMFDNLKNKGAGLNERDACFSFKYPLLLGYNNNSIIQVNNFTGLLDAISNQTVNFNLVGLQFPVEVIFQSKEASFIIKKEEDFIAVLKKCQIQTFRGEIDTLFGQCFKFNYPVLLRDKEKKEVVIDSESSFNRFLENNGNDYQPDFKFPIEVLVAPEFNAVKISSYYEFYEILNNCVGCFDARFQIESLTDNIYRFVPDFEIKEGYQLLFKINGEIHSEIVESAPFEKSFTPGVYNVCIRATTPDCPNGKEFCKELVVESICPEIIIDYYEEISSQYIYRFIPTVTMLNKDVIVSWYLNDVFVTEKLLSTEYVDIELNQGTNTVCAKVKTENCNEGVKSCVEVKLKKK